MRDARHEAGEAWAKCYALGWLLFLLPSMGWWFQDSWRLVDHEFDYFLGAFAASGQAAWWAGLGKTVHALGFMFLGWGYVRLMGEAAAWNGGRMGKREAWAALGAGLACLAGIPWLNLDVFYYMAKGWQGVSTGASVYEVPLNLAWPNARPELVENVHPALRTILGNYGAPFQWICQAAAALHGDSPHAGLLLFKFFNGVLYGVLCWCVWQLAGPCGTNGRLACLAWACHPLVLFNFLTAAHNDLFMLAPALLALLQLERGRPGLSGFLLGLACSIKLVFVVVAPLAALWIFRRGPGGRNWSRAARFGGVFGISFLVLLFSQAGSWDYFWRMASPQTEIFRSSIQFVYFSVLQAAGLPASMLTKATALGVFFALYMAAAWGLWNRAAAEGMKALAEACAGVMLGVVGVLLPSVGEWYLAWPLVFIVLLAGREAVLVSRLWAVAYMPLVIFMLSGRLFPDMLLSQLAAALLTLSALLLFLRGWMRSAGPEQNPASGGRA